MCPIPTSNLRGHKLLKEKVWYILDRCQESQSIEFKRSGSWEDLKWAIIKTCMAMANLRDGGVIVIGVSENGGTWDPSGIQNGHLQSFDADVVLSQMNSYASPHLEVDVVLVSYRDDRSFLVFDVHEFFDTPVVCKKNGPDSLRNSPDCLAAGEIYVRPTGMPRTTKISDASQLHDLLELAAEKRARRLLEQAQRIGMTAGETSSQQFDKELEGL
jgi:predicted HTH transcriptional regulator